MQQSESIENLAKALIGLQAQMPVAPYDADNPFFKSRYASLNSIWSVCRPLLAEYELGVIQLPVSSSFVDGNAVNAGLSTRLIHSSGEWIEDTFYIPLEAGPRAAQAAGSIITYLRRYSLAALLGVVTDEDSDGEPPGNNGQKPNTKVTPKKASEDESKFASDKQLKFLHVIGTKNYGKDWNAKRHDLVDAITHGRTRSSAELMFSEAHDLIEGINLRFAGE